MHYLLQVPEFEDDATERPRRVADGAGRGASRRRRRRSRRSSRASTRCATSRRLRRPPAVARDAQRARREVEGPPLRSRPAAQRDPLPLVGPAGSAHRVQAGSVHDVRGPDERHLQHVHERFLKVQLVFEQPPPDADPATATPQRSSQRRDASGYNALGILEDIRRERWRTEGRSRHAVSPRGTSTSDRRRRRQQRRRRAQGSDDRRRRSGVDAEARQRSRRHVDWSTVGRNDPCPCGSGKKFKKCHGA